MKYLSHQTIRVHQKLRQKKKKKKKKWIEVNDLSSGQYSVNKCIMLKSSMLESNLCDYIDAYIVNGHIEGQ